MHAREIDYQARPAIAYAFNERIVQTSRCISVDVAGNSDQHDRVDCGGNDLHRNSLSLLV
jgi:hypothetical protein